MAGMWLSVGIACMPNRLWQFDAVPPSCSPCWWDRKDSLCMKNSEKADVRHREGHAAATPLVGKARARRTHAVEKGLEHLHYPLGSRLGTMHHT